MVPAQEFFREHRAALTIVIPFALAALFARSAAAITDEEVFRQIRLNPTTYGAAALAMGGASVVFAGDATAIQGNPAGLALLPSAGLLVDLRSRSSEGEIDSGQDDGLAFGFGRNRVTTRSHNE